MNHSEIFDSVVGVLMSERKGDRISWAASVRVLEALYRGLSSQDWTDVQDSEYLDTRLVQHVLTQCESETEWHFPE